MVWSPAAAGGITKVKSVSPLRLLDASPLEMIIVMSASSNLIVRFSFSAKFCTGRYPLQYPRARIRVNIGDFPAITVKAAPRGYHVTFLGDADIVGAAVTSASALPVVSLSGTLKVVLNSPSFPILYPDITVHRSKPLDWCRYRQYSLPPYRPSATVVK